MSCSSIPEGILAISLCKTSTDYKEPINFNVITDTLLGTNIREDGSRKRGVNTKAVCYPMHIHEPFEKVQISRADVSRNGQVRVELEQKMNQSGKNREGQRWSGHQTGVDYVHTGRVSAT